MLPTDRAKVKNNLKVNYSIIFYCVVPQVIFNTCLPKKLGFNEKPKKSLV